MKNIDEAALGRCLEESGLGHLVALEKFAGGQSNPT